MGVGNAVAAYNSAIALVKDEALIPADAWTDERVEFIRRQYCGGAPDPVADAFIQISKRRQLSPEEKQIYIVKRGNAWSIETGIDGYRLIAERTRAYAGSDEPTFEGKEAGHPLKATMTVYRLVAGVRCAFTASVRWSEFAPKDLTAAGAFQYRDRPYHMLGIRAEAQALRKAFPAELSGLELGHGAAEEAPVAEAAEPAPDRSPITMRTMARLHALGSERGFDHDALHQICVERFGLNTMNELIMAEATVLADWLKGQPPVPPADS